MITFVRIFRIGNPHKFFYLTNNKGINIIN